MWQYYNKVFELSVQKKEKNKNNLKDFKLQEILKSIYRNAVLSLLKENILENWILHV